LVGELGTTADSLRLQQILMRGRWTSETWTESLKGYLGVTFGYNRLQSRFYDTSSSTGFPVAVANGASIGLEGGFRIYDGSGAFDLTVGLIMEGAIYNKTVTSVPSSATYTVQVPVLWSFMEGINVSGTIRF
jgi:hypothetical protein